MATTPTQRWVIPSIPIAQPRQRHTRSGFNYVPKESPIHAFKATIRHVVGADSSICDGPLRLTLTCVFPRTKGQVWKKRPMPRMWHTKKPDADNVAKAVKDALNKILWRDDSQVCELIVRKHIAAGDEQPHVVIECQEVDE